MRNIVGHVALDDRQFAGVEPDELAPFASIYNRGAAAEIGMSLHTRLALWTVNDALEFFAID